MFFSRYAAQVSLALPRAGTVKIDNFTHARSAAGLSRGSHACRTRYPCTYQGLFLQRFPTEGLHPPVNLPDNIQTW